MLKENYNKEIEFINGLAGENEIPLDDFKFTPKKIKSLYDFIYNLDKENPLYEIEFVIEGNPEPASRPRTSTTCYKDKTGKLRFNTRWYDPKSKDKKELLNKIKKLFPDDWKVAEGEIYLDIKIYRNIVNGFNLFDKFLSFVNIIRPIQKPDVDNLAKQLMDSINKFVYKDDSQVVDLRLRKFYSIKPRTECKIKFREYPITTKKNIN